MKAVIMAGGQGSRLRPLTCDLPKPMVPIVNYPVMEHIINLLKRYGITDIAVTTYYLPGVIEDYFGKGEKWGVNLHYFIEEEPLGTAGSVHNADQFLDETFLVISGDAITDFDLEKGISFHREKQADATLIMAKEEIPLEYGVIMTDEQGEIVRFLEKPNWGQVFSDTINTGIYVLEPSIFDLYQKGVNFDFSKDLFPLMLREKKRLYGVALEGYWNDIGNLEEYYRTQFDLLEGRINLPIQACSVIDDNIWVEDGVEIDESVSLTGPLYIGRGSKIAGGVRLEKSVIGRNCLIHSHASIKRSILWDNNNIGSHAEIRGAILANNVTLQERTAVFDRTAIGKKVFIGRESRIQPGIKIWPDREIGNKMEVDRSVVWPEYWSRHLFSNRGVVGQSNIEITPEFVASLAIAYASTLQRGDEVVVGSDNYNISDALKKTLTGGLQASGIKVVDIGENITAITRYSVVKLAARGGVHIRVSNRDPQKVIIEFLNSQGVSLSVNEQKDIERKFLTEDYNRVGVNEIGEYSYAPEMAKNYLEDLLQNINQEEIRRNYFSVVVDYEHDSLGNILPLFLKRLNCQLLSTRNCSQNNLPLSIEERLQVKERVARIMRDNQFNLGIIIDHNGEELHLVNKAGEVLSKAQYQLLISYILLEKGFKELYLPLNSPKAIETLAEGYGAKVHYTPINPQVPMDRYYKQLANREDLDPPYFYPYTDGIAGLALILERMARDDLNLDQLLNRLPEFYLNNAEVPCDWKSKGRVMRHLSEEADRDTELIDGIKFNHPQGWALVVPDSERPIFHVFAEGEDLETAESLTGFYLNKVKELINGST